MCDDEGTWELDLAIEVFVDYDGYMDANCICGTGLEWAGCERRTCPNCGATYRLRAAAFRLVEAAKETVAHG